MSRSKIEWTEETWNPVTGCTKVSAGCDNCYAERQALRLQKMGSPRYVNGFDLTLHWDKINDPLRWKRPRLVFVNSMSDLFHPDVPDDFIDDVFRVMREAEAHTFQVLTKRPQRMRRLFDTGTPSSNIWLGTSIETTRYAYRADHLRETPAAVRFLSIEPMLDPLQTLDLTNIDWVIVGGESGPNHRPMKPNWVRNMRDRCVAAEIPFFVKQGSGPQAGRQYDLPDDLWAWKQMPQGATR